MTDTSIKIENLRKVFPGNPNALVVFDGLSLSFKQDAITGVIGPSGCGKTTLLRMIAGLEKPTSGKINFMFNNSHRVGMIFQEYTAFPWKTAGGNIAFALELAGVPSNMREEIIDYWLEKVGLQNFKNYYPAQLSGGMKQRLAFARCLAIKPDVLLMDEPFGSLDSITRDEMVEFTSKLLVTEHTSTIFITHNIKEALRLCDDIFVMSTHPSQILNSFSIEFEKPSTRYILWSKEAQQLEKEIMELL